MIIVRNAFIQELILLAESNEQIVLVVGDLGYSVVEPFAARFPDRFINAGVAEQNMTGLAAGMASEGYHIFTYSIANFPIFRCAEQIRNDIDYHKLSVTVVAVGGGLAYGSLGYSHHAVQDYALMRSFPNMLVASPGDPMEVRACLRYLVDHPQPSYLRLGKAGEPLIHSEVPLVSPGHWVPIQIGKKKGKTFLTTGAPLELVHNILQQNSEFKDCSLYSMPLWSMDSKGLQANQVDKFSTVITLEDHLLDGGFGSWLQESLNLHPDLIGKVRINALDEKVCGLVGSQAYLNNIGGLNFQKIRLSI